MDDRAFLIYQPEFRAYLNRNGYISVENNSWCSFYKNTVEAEYMKQNSKDNTARYNYTYVTATDWRPSNVVVNKGVIKEQEPVVGSGKGDSIIVRQPDEAPVKPAAKSAPKPAAKAKPAAKPIPKKPLSKCGGKGQRRCKVKSM